MTMKGAKEWISDLKMEPHPEGGYFIQTYKSDQMMTSNAGNQVPIYTTIYFVLEDNNPSNFHKIQSDEMWYYHDGNPLTVHCIYPDGKYEKTKIGKNVQAGEKLHYLVPRGTIFGSSVDEDYSLVSCLVSPGFSFEEFELFKCDDLLAKYPQHEEIIRKLTRD